MPHFAGCKGCKVTGRSNGVSVFGIWSGEVVQSAAACTCLLWLVAFRIVLPNGCRRPLGVRSVVKRVLAVRQLHHTFIVQILAVKGKLGLG